MISNYNADISWLLEYTDNYIIYDRSDSDKWTKIFDQSKVLHVKNIGWDIYDKLTYIIDNYDHLPNSMILTKGNIFKYITKEEFDQICDNAFFTPIFTKNHLEKPGISFYSEDGMYNEKNNSWYLDVYPAKYFLTFNEFIKYIVDTLPSYVKFAPGSNYIVTKENIQKYPKVFYEKLKLYVSYSPHPGEAQIIERAMYTLWNPEISVNKNFIYLPTHPPIETLIQNTILVLKKLVKKILR